MSAALLVSEWLVQAGVSAGPIDIVSDGTAGGIRVIAAQCLRPDTTLAVIPKSAVLSVHTSCIAPVIARAEIGGGVALALAVMVEQALGARSFWAGYLSSCPRQAHIPIFWRDHERAYLDGTEQEGVAEGELDALQQDYYSLIQPLLRDAPELSDLPANKTDIGSFCRAGAL